MSVISGRKVCSQTSAGEPLAATPTPIGGPVIVKAIVANDGLVYLGGSLTIATNNAFTLLPGESVVLDYVGDLSSLFLRVSVANEGVEWLRLSV